MRVNARLDDNTQEQLNYLTTATGQTVSHVVRESVAQYYVQVRGAAAKPKAFLALVGKGHGGRSDVASNVKRELSEALAAKLAAQRGLPRKRGA